jgi:hypothetical protein
MNLDDYLYDNNYGCGCGLNDLAARSTKADRERFFREQPKLSKADKKAMAKQLTRAGTRGRGECTDAIINAKERAELDALRLRQFRRANPEFQVTKKPAGKRKTTKEIVVATTEITCANPSLHKFCTLSTIATGKPDVKKYVQKNFARLEITPGENAKKIESLIYKRLNKKTTTAEAKRGAGESKQVQNSLRKLGKKTSTSSLEKMGVELKTKSNKSLNKAISKKIASVKRKKVAAEMKRDRYLDKELAT